MQLVLKITDKKLLSRWRNYWHNDHFLVNDEIYFLYMKFQITVHIMIGNLSNNIAWMTKMILTASQNWNFKIMFEWKIPRCIAYELKWCQCRWENKNFKSEWNSNIETNYSDSSAFFFLPAPPLPKDENRWWLRRQLDDFELIF